MFWALGGFKAYFLLLCYNSSLIESKWNCISSATVKEINVSAFYWHFKRSRLFFAASNLGVENVYETPSKHEAVKDLVFFFSLEFEVQKSNQNVRFLLRRRTKNRNINVLGLLLTSLFSILQPRIWAWSMFMRRPASTRPWTEWPRPPRLQGPQGFPPAQMAFSGTLATTPCIHRRVRQIEFKIGLARALF